MKILMLSWEYPPKNIGGLSTHVYYLSHALVAAGNDVHVITCEEGTAPIEEYDKGVYVHRVEPYKIETDDFIKWVMQLNFAMVEKATSIIKKEGYFDIIHAHDWLATFAARTIKWAFNIPIVCTIHATEYGRNNGIKTDMQRYISSVEWMLSYDSWKVITCSNYMRQQISDVFSTPWDKIWVIPNGVETHNFDFEFDWLEFRRKFAIDDEKIIFFIGRHVFEKGVHNLIEAAPQIVNGCSRAKFIIAGKGPMSDELIDRVKSMGLTSKFLFTGYMDDDTRNKLYRVANVAVFPSLYEPFGIVALEAMSAGCPVVVSDTGGLGEIVEHRVNGLKAICGMPQSYGDNILEILRDDALASNLKENAYKTVYEKYTWDKVSELTIKLYNSVKEETSGTEWEFKNDLSLVSSVNEIKEKAFKESEELKNKIALEINEMRKNALEDINALKSNAQKEAKSIKSNAEKEAKTLLVNAEKEAKTLKSAALKEEKKASSDIKKEAAIEGSNVKESVPKKKAKKVISAENKDAKANKKTEKDSEKKDTEKKKKRSSQKNTKNSTNNDLNTKTDSKSNENKKE